MRLRALLGVAAALAIAAGAAAFRLIRRRRELAAKAHRPELPAGPPVEEETISAATPASDEPLARQTRFDEHLDEEEQRRHAAARRLRTEFDEEP
jgi:hypothetical protein